MRVCEAWYIVRLNVLEELNNLIQSRNEDLIKANEDASITDFIGSMHIGMLLCFIRMHLSMVLCFIGTYLILIYKCCLIYIL